MVDISSIIEGTVKFRDGKKWKSRWCVMRKLSPVADCLHLQLYRDSKDRYKHGQTKASLSLQQFLGVESGFTLDKESNTIAIICQDVTVVLAFDTRERLIQWQVKIAHNLGEDIQYLILVSSAPPKAKIATGPARMHIQDHRFCLTTGVPPKMSGLWEIGHLRRYGVIDNRFCFEGGTNCGKGEGLYVMVTDQGEDITQTLKAAAQGKLATKRRPMARKISEIDSPRRSTHRGGSDENGTDTDHIGPCPSLSSRASYWDVDSNFGCGDTVSVSEAPLDCINDSDVIYPGQTITTANIERCMSCFSKLGAPSMSRSSTGIGSQYGYGQQQVWALNSGAMSVTNDGNSNNSCGHHKSNQNNAVAVDRMSLCSSQGSSSNNSEYSIAKLLHSSVGLDLWNANAKDSTKTCTCSNGGNLTLRRTGLVCTVCDGCPPAKPPKAATQKPPMPLPITTQLQPTQHGSIGAYDNYDFPRVLSKIPLSGENNGLENYDTPKKIHEYILAGDVSQQPPVNTADYSNYDMPTAIVGQMCSCLHSAKDTAQGEGSRGRAEADAAFSAGRSDCACNRVMSWADNWICRRGNSVENTGVAVNKLKLTGEGKMPIVQMNPQSSPLPAVVGGDSKQSELYATVDVTKKLKSRLIDTSTLKKCQCAGVEKDQKQRGSTGGDRPDSQLSNYINIDPRDISADKNNANYANLTFAHATLDSNYENAKEVGCSAGSLPTAHDKIFVHESVLSTCQKCGHASITEDSAPNEERTKEQARNYNQNYLVMEPKRIVAEVPGYLPMSPALSSNQQFNHGTTTAYRKSALIDQTINDKSASNPSIHVSTSCEQSDATTSFDKSSCLSRVLLTEGGVSSAKNLNIRTRSASADSSRFLEDVEEFESSETLRKTSCNSVHESRRLSSPCVLPKTDPIVNIETEDEMSVSLTTHSQPTNTSVNIRRSESVPCKAQNRDSSSSNDSGVSTGSLRLRSKDFETFDKKHRNSLPCTHVTLPRRSKSSDPLKELSFRFRKNRIPEKSTSAEAEVPVCPPKAFQSPADGQSLTGTVPYIDSRSTSSGTSDMSDYIETLSMSSHSSADVADAARLNRPSTSTLRPRSGKEYQNIDRSLLCLSQPGTDIVMDMSQPQQQLRALHSGNYANITPVPESAESPSPGYQSSSPPYSQLY